MLHLNRLKRVREKRDPNVISKFTQGLCSYYYAARAYSILLNSKGTKAALCIHFNNCSKCKLSLSFHPFPLPQMAKTYSSTASLTLPYMVDCGVVRLKGHNIDQVSPNGPKSYIFILFKQFSIAV